VHVTLEKTSFFPRASFVFSGAAVNRSLFFDFLAHLFPRDSFVFPPHSPAFADLQPTRLLFVFFCIILLCSCSPREIPASSSTRIHFPLSSPISSLFLLFDLGPVTFRPPFSTQDPCHPLPFCGFSGPGSHFLFPFSRTFALLCLIVLFSGRTPAQYPPDSEWEFFHQSSVPSRTQPSG